LDRSSYIINFLKLYVGYVQCSPLIILKHIWNYFTADRPLIFRMKMNGLISSFLLCWFYCQFFCNFWFTDCFYFRTVSIDIVTDFFYFKTVSVDTFTDCFYKNRRWFCSTLTVGKTVGDFFLFTPPKFSFPGYMFWF
jgi:hypothetical protein